MSKQGALTSLEFINRVEYDRKAGAYRYTMRPKNKTEKFDTRGKFIKQYAGYLWIKPHYYSKQHVDVLYAPFMRTNISHVQYEWWLDPNSERPHNPEELKDVHGGMLLFGFDTAAAMPGVLHPPAGMMPDIEKARNRAVLADFNKRKEENEQNEAYNNAPGVLGYKVVKPIHRIITEVAADHTLPHTTVRNILIAANALRKDTVVVKHRPTTRMPSEYKFFADSFNDIRRYANAYYTGGGFGARNISRGFGGNRIAPGFLIDLTKMLYESEGKYQPPLECQVTLQPFNEESMRDPKKKQHRWNDIVIGRLDVRKPAHYENLAFMTRLARDVMEGQHKYSSWAKKAWEKLNCTEEQWREAMEKTEYGVTKFMEGLKR